MAARSVRDVAQHAGVSVGTVSNVLNHPEKVLPATVARVLDSIDQLGFIRNDAARQLRAGRSMTIGLILLQASNPFFTEVARGVEEGASELGFSVLLGNSEPESPARTRLPRTVRAAAGARRADLAGRRRDRAARGPAPHRDRGGARRPQRRRQPHQLRLGGRRGRRPARRRAPDRAGSSSHRLSGRTVRDPAGHRPARGRSSRGRGPPRRHPRGDRGRQPSTCSPVAPPGIVCAPGPPPNGRTASSPPTTSSRWACCSRS